MDDRFRALDAWLRATLAGAPFRVERASADASFRRYFRVFLDGRTVIAMDAPPERENSRAFVQVAQLLRAAGLNAPEILEQDLAQGFLLVTDLGTTPYLAALDGEYADRLYRDAFVSWDEERVLDGTIRYWEKARRASLPVRADFADFWRDVEWMGLQRHLKVLGIFARLHHRDGKAGYLEDTPRFIGYVRRAVGRYDELAPLGRLLDELECAVR